MKILNLKKIEDKEINNFIDKAYKIEETVEALDKDNILKSKSEILSQINDLATKIINSKTKFENEKDEIYRQLEKLSSYYSMKYFVVGFD